jgi:chromosomal replication initiator protein
MASRENNDDKRYNFINPVYTFDVFVVGSCNDIACRTALSFSTDLSGKYNPCFLYGESGLGKTHLLHAAGNVILAERPDLKILYTSFEQFKSEFSRSKEDNTYHNFQKKFREVDVLFVDDIQFIENSGESQIEFFVTFESLYKRGSRIFFASDRPISDFLGLDERLKIGFTCGFHSEIKKPDFETRKKILRKKADDDAIMIMDDVICCIAERIQRNVRKIESALSKIQFISSLYNEPISLKMAEIHLKHLFD